MFDPYRMIVVNVILSVTILTCFLINRYIYPKKRVSLFLLLIFISVLPVISIFRVGTYESGDFNTHVYRLVSFHTALADGELIPSWSRDLNAKYGYPLFIFLNPLPYYIGSLFHVIGFSFLNSIKILLALSYIFSGVFMYVFIKKELKHDLAAFTAAIVYLFAPYHFVDLHFRAAVGETLFFAVFPIFLYTLTHVVRKQTVVNTLVSGLICSLLFFSHQAMAVFFLPIIAGYIFLHRFLQKKRTFFSTFKPFIVIILGFVLSSYTWLPHITYPKYTYAWIITDLLLSFPKISELLFSPYRWGLLFQGPNGELSYLIGYAQLLIIGMTFYLLFQHIKKPKGLTQHYFQIMFLIFVFGLIFMMTPFSAILWKTLPVLNTVQFSSRLLLPLVFCVSMLAGYLALQIKNNVFVFILVIFTIGTTIINWGHRRIIPEITNETLVNNVPLSTYYGEAHCCMGSPKWVDIRNPWMNELPPYPAEIVEGSGSITLKTRKTAYHEYSVNAHTPLLIRENTLYFPGWTAALNNKTVHISPQKTPYQGVMQISIPKGIHTLSISYKDLPHLYAAKIISGIGIAGTLLFVGINTLNALLRKYGFRLRHI